MSALRGEGLLALWGSVDPAQEDGFNDWYTHEHLPERIALPGFLRARRYVADVGRVGERSPGRYFTIYETTSVAALSSAEYLHALDHPTPATSRYMPLFAAMSRTGCRVLSSRSLGVGDPSTCSTSSRAAAPRRSCARGSSTSTPRRC